MSTAARRAILLTPSGEAAIAVVRLTGAGVSEFLRAHFSAKTTPGKCIYGMLRDGDLLLDDAVVVEGRGESFADLNLHGGRWIVQSVLELAAREGYEVITSSSVPLEALAVDANTMLEQEMLTHLPAARTELAVKVLLKQPEAWRKFVKSQSSVLAESFIRELQKIMSDPALFSLLSLPKVAIVGAANVGKSTLANELFAREQSITADVPGTTRDWVGEIANIDGLAVMLVDTPGLRQTLDTIEQEAIRTSQDQIAGADLVILVIDASRRLEEAQESLLKKFGDPLVVLNKTDLPMAPGLERIKGLRLVATTGVGIDSLRQQILSRFGCRALIPDAPRIWTARHRSVMQRAMHDPLVISEII